MTSLHCQYDVSRVCGMYTVTYYVYYEQVWMQYSLACGICSSIAYYVLEVVGHANSYSSIVFNIC